MEFIPEIARTAWTQYINSRSLKDNLDLLRIEMQELGSRQTDVIISLNTAKVVDGKKPKAEVSLWLENVEKITSQMTKIEEDCKEVGRDFLRSRVALGNLVTKKIEEVVKLKEKGQFSEGLLADLLPEMGIMPTTKLVGRTTAERNLEQIWESLMDDEARIIGVYGMGGVGKTTIMRHIYNRIKNEKIWVTVSNDSSVERLQNNIAQAIGLDLSNEHDEMRRSMKLSEALKRREKLVVIFDDVWNSFPLEMVGIAEDMACKIVLTTRSKNVCRAMNCQKMFEVKVLSPEESWELFKERLGVNTVLSYEVEQIAKLVAKECAGLPLGIITVASAMREKNDIREWENALDELKCSTMDIEGMDDKVFQILKFSYDRLKNEKIQSCFLYCALFPEDYEIHDEDLIRYWMVEGLIDDMGDWEKKVNKGCAILNGLIDVCMLVRCKDDKVVMHDLIRDLAISITRKSPRFVVKAGIQIWGSIGIEEFPEDADRVSFMRNEIEMLSGEPNCPKLSTLILQKNLLLGNISREFFNRMNSLRVLDLSETQIEFLPASVSNLENLHALLLHECYRLREVPSLAKLKRLRILNLSFSTQIEYLPASVSNLENLHALLLQGCTMLRGVPSLAKLKLLRILNFSETQIKYLPASVSNLENLHALLLNNCTRLREVPSLAKLKRLRILNLEYTDIKEVPDGMECLVNLKVLYVSSAEETIVGCNSLVLPDSIVELVMERCDLSSLPCLSHLQRLQKCEIRFCSSMEWLLPIRDDSTITSLPSIQELSLVGLRNLRGLCEGVLLPGSFACLTRLTVVGCQVLENLMSLELFQHLQCLDQISSTRCSEMEEVIKGGEEAMVEEEGYNNNNNNSILLPKLRELELRNLGKLKSICKQVIICPSMKWCVIAGCPRLKKIPLSLGNSSTVGKKGVIRGSKEWWDALEWDDPNTKTLLRPHFEEKEIKEEEDDEEDEDQEDEEEEDDEEDEEDGEREGRGMKRRAEEESEEVASTSRQRLSPHN